MSKNTYIYNNNKLKLSVLNSLLSWLNRMAYDDCDDKLIRDIEKYFSKYKMKIVSESDLKFLTKRLKFLQKVFEDEITIGERRSDGTYETISFSYVLLSLLALDYLINVENDLSLKVKFGHISLKNIFDDVEKNDKELFYSSLKIFDKLVGSI